MEKIDLMKKLLLILLFVPLCVACEKEEEPGEDVLPQYHFINFVNDSGENLFENNQIPTSNFFYVAGDSKESWEDLMAEREIQLSIISDEKFQQTVSEILENNEYLLVENFQGERERVLSINGEEYTFRMSPLKDGFFQDSDELEYSTDTVDNDGIYLHHIVLNKY